MSKSRRNRERNCDDAVSKVVARKEKGGRNHREGARSWRDFAWHGNYGGPGYTGGRFTGGSDDDSDYGILPRDAADQIYRWHDYHYRVGFDRAAADRIAAGRLRYVPGFKSKLAAFALQAQGLARGYLGDPWWENGAYRSNGPSDFESSASTMERSLTTAAQVRSEASDSKRIHAKGASRSSSMSYSTTIMTRDAALKRRPNLRLVHTLPFIYDDAAETIPTSSTYPMAYDLTIANMLDHTDQFAPSDDMYMTATSGLFTRFTLGCDGWFRFRANIMLQQAQDDYLFTQGDQLAGALSLKLYQNTTPIADLAGVYYYLECPANGSDSYLASFSIHGVFRYDRTDAAGNVYSMALNNELEYYTNPTTSGNYLLRTWVNDMEFASLDSVYS